MTAKGPHILAVGPPKTGTSWLAEALRHHPEIHVPPIKELRYFSERWEARPRGIAGRFIGKSHWTQRQYRDHLAYTLKRLLRNPTRLRNTSRLRWDCAYLFGYHDDAWYRDAFDHEYDDAVLAIDTSPQYFFLPPSEIARIAALLPDAKIVISLREPGGWLRSLTRMIMSNERMERSHAAYRAYAGRKAKNRRFSEALMNWWKYFPKENVGVFFYDELSCDPAGYLYGICRFLGVEQLTRRDPYLFDRINVGAKDTDGVLAEDFGHLWADDMRKLNTLVPVPAGWTTGDGSRNSR